MIRFQTQLTIFPFFLSREVGSIEGGTHNVAHAYQRILYENGGEWYPWHKVDKIIIENGRAKGVQLADGSQIEAKKVVVSGVNIKHLCSDLIGKDYISPKILRKLETVIGDIKGLAWYTWFLHDLPQYTASGIDPNIVNSSMVTLGKSDTRSWWDAMALRRMGKNPPVDGKLLVVHHSAYDKTRSPEGKHVVLTDFDIVTATFLKEREWLDFKKAHAKEALADWQKYAPNMTNDNIPADYISTPFDTENKFPNMRKGCFKQGAYLPLQMGYFRPNEYCCEHTTPIKKLYMAGSCTHSGGMITFGPGYCATEKIAEDLGIEKWWPEPQHVKLAREAGLF